MAAVDFTDLDYGATERYGSNAVTVKNTLDFASNPCDAVSPVLDIPAGAWVTHVAVNVTTTEGASVAFTLGDGSDADGWMTGGNANTSGYKIMVGAYATATTVRGKVYSSADTLDITPAAELDAAVIEVIMSYIQL